MTAERAPLSVEALEGTVENERVELMQVHAMLKCLYQVLLYADDDDSLMHADVANVAARLIVDSVERLEKMVSRLKAEADASA